MQIIYAKQALLPQGWTCNVRVGIRDDGRIAFVEHGDSQEQLDRDGTVSFVETLLPAPANVHSHAFQRAMAGLTEKRGPNPFDSFWTWRELMYKFIDQLTPEDVEAIAAFVQMEMLEAGYCANVEFHYLHNQPNGAFYANPAELSERIAAAASLTGIGLTLLPVHYQYGGCDQRPLKGGQRRFSTELSEFELLWARAAESAGALPADTRVGVAPHSLRAVSPASLNALQQIAPDAPFHMHLAEQIAEVEEVEKAWGARPVEWLLNHAEVDERWCLIHCTQMLRHETKGLAQTGAVVGLCPITESSLGDGVFDGVNYLNEGGRIGIGSDSNVRISLSEELRTLDYSQRLRDRTRAALASSEQSTGRRLFESVTSGGARAAGRESGSIAVDMWADLLSLDAEHPDTVGRTDDTLLDTFIFAGDDRMVTDVWAAGRHQVASGQHVQREPIVENYKRVMKKLGGSL